METIFTAIFYIWLGYLIGAIATCIYLDRNLPEDESDAQLLVSTLVWPVGIHVFVKELFRKE